MDKQDLSRIYQFWFGEQPCIDAAAEERVRYWMEQSDETDRVIRRSFGHLIAAAAGQSWSPAELSRNEAMALIVLFDQFPRNIYRSDAEAYAYDPMARSLAGIMVADGWEIYSTLEQFTLGLPFVHNEDLADQNYILELAEAKLALASPGTRPLWQQTVDQSRKHRDIIQRFGRFPHRNEALGRESTIEEKAFLSQYGRGF